jgi:heme A synthase
VTALHGAISNSLLLLLLICLGWSVLGLISGRGVSPGLRGTLIIALGVAIAQVALGVLLVTLGGRPFSPIHALYGISLVAALAGAAIYGGRATRQREVLIYALVTLFSAGLALRAIETVGRLN